MLYTHRYFGKKVIEDVVLFELISVWSLEENDEQMTCNLCFPKMDLFDYFLTLSGAEVSGKWAMGGSKGYQFSFSTETKRSVYHIPAEGLVVDSSYADKVSIQRREEGPWEKLNPGRLTFEPVFAVKWEMVRKDGNFIIGTFFLENGIGEHMNILNSNEAAIAHLEKEINERKAAIKLLSESSHPKVM